MKEVVDIPVGHRFWFWWDERMIQKPFRQVISKVWGCLIALNIVGFLVGGVIAGNWDILTMILLIFGEMIICNLVIAGLNSEICSKYYEKWWHEELPKYKELRDKGILF